jgi:hypothetical protein
MFDGRDDADAEQQQRSDSDPEGGNVVPIGNQAERNDYDQPPDERQIEPVHEIPPEERVQQEDCLNAKSPVPSGTGLLLFEVIFSTTACASGTP